LKFPVTIVGPSELGKVGGGKELRHGGGLLVEVGEMGGKSEL
jgi:hypothetical protein